jgi:hypothetical protein
MKNSSQVYSWPKLLWHDSFPNLRLDHNNQALTKSMFIKVREVTFGFCENLSPKLRNYSTRTGLWLPALAATTNQPFGMHFEHVHVPTNSPCLPPLLGPRFFLTPLWESNFDLGLRKKFHLSKPIWQPFLYVPNVHDVIFWKLLAFISLVTWCGTFMWLLAPLKERWCPHHVLRIFCFFVGLMWNSFMAF